jgi:signal recognition particle subunit SRP54
MFESLSTRLQDVFKSLRGEARLTETSVDAALREIRLALLEADVNFRVVKAFIERVRVQAVGDDVLRSLTPAQQVVRIVRDEMLALFGEAPGGLPPTPKSPRVVLMLGLQGAGKTTASAKLAYWLTKQSRHPMLVSTDVPRSRTNTSQGSSVTTAAEITRLPKIARDSRTASCSPATSRW